MQQVFFNPASGSVQEGTLNRLHELLGVSWIDYRLHVTKKGEDLRAAVRTAFDAGAEQIVAAGGDGTVSEVAAALVGTGVPLGVLPLGTGNVLAQEMGIPTDLEAACALLTDDQPATVALDAMRIGDDHFFSHVSMGLYAQIATDTPPEEKKRFGRLAYVRSALQKIVQGRAWTFEIRCDGQTRKVRASTVMVANAGAVGIAGLQWGEGINPTDGTIDLCVVRAESPNQYLAMLSKLMRRSTTAQPEIGYYRARHHVAIRSAKRIPVRGDGEVIGRQQVGIQVVPHAVRVVVPSAAAHAA